MRSKPKLRLGSRVEQTNAAHRPYPTFVNIKLTLAFGIWLVIVILKRKQKILYMMKKFNLCFSW